MSSSDLDDLKTILNSLVIPHPTGLSLRQLCYEYQDLEGQMIPFQKFGFSSVTALLKSMPSMIRMVGNLMEINSVVLYPVKNETTKHIIDLVQKQSKVKKKSRGRPSFPRFSAFSSRPPARPLSRSANTYRNDFDLQLNAMNSSLFNDLFVAYYKYFDVLSKMSLSLPLNPLLLESSLSETNLYNQNISQYSRPNVQNIDSNWRPVLPSEPQKPLLNFNGSQNGGYTPHTVFDYTKPQNMAPNITANVPTLGEKFLNFRITKTMNKLNEQQSETRTLSNVDSIANSFNNLSVNSPTIASNSSTNLIPKQIKDNIRLMMSSPDIEEGFMLFNFEARYRHQFKESFDYKKYGFPTLTECLKNMTDVLDMIPTGTKTYKLMPLKTSAQQKSGSSVTSVITNGHTIAVITSTASSTSVTLVTTHSTTTTNTVSTTPKYLFTIPISQKAKNELPKPLVSNTMSSQSLLETKFTDKCFDTQSVCSSASTDNINNKAKQNFRTILLFHENGINAVDFASEYEKYFKIKFDPRIWGFRTCMELFYGLPKIFAIEVNDKNEEILHDSRFKKFEPKPTKPKLDMNTKFLLRQIPDVIFGRILRVIQMMSPLGASLSNFVTLYDDKFPSIGTTLRSLRFSDVKHLFETIKDEIPIDIREIDGEERLFIKSKEELREWTARQTRASRFIIAITLVDSPANVVLPGEQYRPIQLPERFKPGNYEYVAAYISSAVNPHEIYIQFKGTEYHTALEGLMFSLEFYEKASEEQWAVPYEYLYVGYPVVCRYPGDKHWHRARVSRIHASDKRVVTVSFVDYGGTHVLDYKNLRLMKKEFLSLPVQSLKVGLYGIKPILGHKASDWTASARDKLLRFSKPTYALACTLIEVRADNHWVAICDTNTAVDIFLHLVLVNDKHALLSDDDINSSDDPQSAAKDKENVNYNSRGIAQTNGY